MTEPTMQPSVPVERNVETADGLTLFVRDYTAGCRSSAAPVVCLHGLTRNSRDFECVAPCIAASGRRVLAIDMRGRGNSSRDPDPRRYRTDVYARDVIGMLDTLDIAQAVFFGTSMGGIITMVLNVLAPARVAAAVLNDIGPVLNPAGIGRITNYVGKVGPYASWEAVTTAIRAVQSAAYPDAGDGFWAAFARRAARELPDGAVVLDYDPAIRDAFLQPPPNPPPDMKAMFGALKTKSVLVLHGALSDILTADGIAAMRDIKPDLTLAEVPDVGHAPTLDEPESRAAIAAFLARVP
jgi:pimeloyl-ACP methyl ester carboxylesterase